MELVYNKNYFNLTKVFVLKLFQMAANQSAVIKSLVVEKCKLYEIYKKICDMHREAFFRQKDIYKQAKYRFVNMNPSWKGNPWNENVLTLW